MPPLLQSFVAGQPGAAHVCVQGAGDAQPAGGEERNERHLGGLAIDDHVVAHENRETLGLFELDGQRGDLPVGVDRPLEMDYLVRILALVLPHELLQAGLG